MKEQDLLPWIIFGAATVAVWVIGMLFSQGKTRAAERLEELRDPNTRVGEGKDRKQSFVERTAPSLSKALEPRSEAEQSELRIRLANAGFNGSKAPQMFLAAKFCVGLLLTTIGASFGMVKYGWNMQGLMSVCIAGGLGFYGPEIWLWAVRRGRMERIFLSLPDALDLLVVCVEAGLGLDSGMRRVSEELEDTHPDLCFEFNMCNMQLQMGRVRKDVLHDIGIRSGVDDMKSLAAILIQADKFGSSIAQALRVQSDSMRIKRKQMAEEKAQQTSVKMIFPLVLFIFPGVFVVLVGPAAIMMINNLLNT